MGGYQPLKIVGNSAGLVQERENFILPNDAYPILQNAYVWRERIKRKRGCLLLGRLQRNLTVQALGNSVAGVWSFNLYSTLIPAITGEPNAQLIPGSVFLAVGGITFTDNGNGTLTGSAPGNSATVNYATGDFVVTHTAGVVASFINFNYYPGLPVMGLRIRELQNSTFDQTIAFDTKYAYNFNGTTWQEFIPGTTWTGNDVQFFWTTNYWTGTGSNKIFWATNNFDFIRYTDGTSWQLFIPQINATPSFMSKVLCLLPFRGRLVAFNTEEGPLGLPVTYSNRIRWAAIGTPFTGANAIIPASNINANAWRDDIRGQGGYLDIPTSEDIVSVGFVRDNLVIYCERSTWQLRYTGRSIAPFQIEKVNSELGAEGTFSTVQFDTSLVGVGDKGIVECDSYKSERIDIKIPDLVFNFQNNNNGPARVHGIRDFVNRLAYWTYPSASANGTYPDKRLVYNYENDSWAIFDDSFTCLGTIQIPSNQRWIDIHIPWVQCNFPWINSQILDDPAIIGGNQQGFVEYLDEQNTNDVSLFIQNITGNTTTPTVITSPNHNLQTGAVIKISNIPTGTPFDNLNGKIFGIIVLNVNSFQLMFYNSSTQKFSTPQLDLPGSYVGGGMIAILDNFLIQSKKFNFMDDGQNIKFGYLDILMNATNSPNPGAITLQMYVDYNDDETTNTLPQNVIADGSTNTVPDGFFNQTIPTTPADFDLNKKGGSKFWQRVYCPTRGNFITLVYTLSNAQMVGVEQASDVQIDAQILWTRRGGRMTQF